MGDFQPFTTNLSRLHQQQSRSLVVHPTSGATSRNISACTRVRVCFHLIVMRMWSYALSTSAVGYIFSPYLPVTAVFPEPDTYSPAGASTQFSSETVSSPLAYVPGGQGYWFEAIVPSRQ